MATIGSVSPEELKTMRADVENLVHWLREASHNELASEDGDPEWTKTAHEHDMDGDTLLKVFDGEDGEGPASKYSRLLRFWAKGDIDATKGRMQTYLNEYDSSRLPGSYPLQALSAKQDTDATLQLCYEAWRASVKKKTMPYALTVGHITKETLSKWNLLSMAPE